MDTKGLVYDAIEEVTSEMGEQFTISDDMKLIRENGIDSLGIVSLVMELENKLDVDLDSYLAEIRKCETVLDLVRLMEKIKCGE